MPGPTERDESCGSSRPEFGTTAEELVAAQADKLNLGVLQLRALCYHGPHSGAPLLEVRGNSLIVPGSLYMDVWSHSQRVTARCLRCLVRYEIDLPELRRVLRLPRTGAAKVSVETIGRRVTRELEPEDVV